MTKNSVPAGFLHRITSDIQDVLTNNRDIAAIWDTLTPLSRNEWICWVTFVKKLIHERNISSGSLRIHAAVNVVPAVGAGTHTVDHKH